MSRKNKSIVFAKYANITRIFECSIFNYFHLPIHYLSSHGVPRINSRNNLKDDAFQWMWQEKLDKCTAVIRENIVHIYI